MPAAACAARSAARAWNPSREIGDCAKNLAIARRKVTHPIIDRIDTGRVCQLVDRGFDGKVRLDASRTAQIHRPQRWSDEHRPPPLMREIVMEAVQVSLEP